MTHELSRNAVEASIDAFRGYLSAYRVELVSLASELRVESDDEGAVHVRGLPIESGLAVLDLAGTPLTRKLVLPLQLDCDVLRLSRTEIPTRSKNLTCRATPG